MVLSYHGFPVTPSALNTYLINHQGYDKTGGIFFRDAVEGYSGGKVKLKILPPMDDRLEKDIWYYGPQIMKLKYGFFGLGTHFVVATGRDRNKTTWLINDSKDATEVEITKWADNYADFREIIGPEYTYVDSRCGLTIRFHSPGELVITDSLGRKEGYDSISGTTYQGQIPDAFYGETGLPNLPEDLPEPQSKEIDISVPAEGEYELKVIGTDVGNYDLEIRAWDREGGRSYKDIEQIPIITNTVHTYILNYSRAAGSKLEVIGGFDGKGQRPKDVNKFLSYSNPTQVTTELLPGVKTFNLSIFYDQAIISGTFKAELNRQDITNLFSSSPGRNEVVKLNLVSGRNTLILSVDGRLSSGRQATDTDRLVFIVP
jgi:hypothetical protein